MELTIKSNNNSNLTEKIASEEITLILNEWDTFTFGSYADKNEAIRAQTDLTTRMAAALTAQAKRIEGLTWGRTFWRDNANAAEATVTELRAEVAKLQEPGGLTVNCLRLGTCSEKTRLEAEVERLTAQLPAGMKRQDRET